MTSWIFMAPATRIRSDKSRFRPGKSKRNTASRSIMRSEALTAFGEKPRHALPRALIRNILAMKSVWITEIDGMND